MKDIESRADLEVLLSAFYSDLLSHEQMRHIFTDVAKIDLYEHLPVITDFWEQVVLHSGSYRNNPMQIHLDLNSKFRLTPELFQLWLNCFNAAADGNFSGENTEKAKTRALSIATIMQIKMQ